MKITFWGTRGSIPCPGPDTVKYGGNTTCLELCFGGANGRMAIIDAGTGIRPLGKHLLSREATHVLRPLDIFLTHTHWDHILGFPFFAPMYTPGLAIRIHGPASPGGGALEKALRGQFASRYFPVSIDELASDIRFAELQEGIFDLGDGIILSTKYLNHPVRCLGYRFECDGLSVATMFDMEQPANGFCSLLEQFYAGADLVICDAQFTAAEYHAGRSGWGHSAMEEAVDFCRRIGVRSLALTHHDPDRSDAEIDRLAETICEPISREEMQVFFAHEGLEIELKGM